MVAPRTHCRSGHPYSLDNTRIYRGERICKACDRLRQRKHKGSSGLGAKPDPEGSGGFHASHGLFRGGRSKFTPEYASWSSAKSRCYNPNDSRYYCYGARGITMCDEWRNSFETFLRDMGPRPIDASIDRIDSGKGYFPENCRWATKKEQAREKRKNFTAFGQTRCIGEWAEVLGVSRSAVSARISKTKNMEAVVSHFLKVRNP